MKKATSWHFHHQSYFMCLIFKHGQIHEHNRFFLNFLPFFYSLTFFHVLLLLKWRTTKCQTICFYYKKTSIYTLFLVHKYRAHFWISSKVTRKPKNLLHKIASIFKSIATIKNRGQNANYPWLNNLVWCNVKNGLWRWLGQ